ncbi:MAG: hypothetical protein ACOYJ2_03210 [Rickettsiales bacterium]
MKKVVMFTMAVLATSPAFAWVKVTNLSGQPQSVTYSVAGSDVTKVIAPNMTEHFMGTEGMLALNGAQAIAKAQSAKPGPAGALLGDVVASNRTSRIPAENDSSFVIWPDGRLLLQTRKDQGSYDF